MQRLIADWLARPAWFQWSAVAVALLLVAGVVAVLVRRRREGAADPLLRRTRRPSEALRAGPALLAGRVELARDESLALRLEVEQLGRVRRYRSEEGDLLAEHTWTESARRTQASAFYLRLDDGTRVRVEPGPRAHLLDDLVPAERPALDTRVCVAELAADDVASAYGVLTRGFDPEASAGDGGYRAAPREGVGAARARPWRDVRRDRAGRSARALDRSAARLHGRGAVGGGSVWAASSAPRPSPNGAAAGLALAGAILLGVAAVALWPRRPTPYVPRPLEHRGDGGLRETEPPWRS
ncbi:MAG: hypothetical protein M5U28_29500 [Sandaracinaceae bacterium]|nr:hypothetical protein [Sandaracinaceae bacterium]